MRAGLGFWSGVRWRFWGSDSFVRSILFHACIGTREIVYPVTPTPQYVVLPATEYALHVRDANLAADIEHVQQRLIHRYPIKYLDHI